MGAVNTWAAVGPERRSCQWGATQLAARPGAQPNAIDHSSEVHGLRRKLAGEPLYRIMQNRCFPKRSGVFLLGTSAHLDLAEVSSTTYCVTGEPSQRTLAPKSDAVGNRRPCAETLCTLRNPGAWEGSVYSQTPLREPEV